jgi:hypothetical protein
MDEKSWIQANWLAPSQIKAGCTTRLGGHSQGTYASLNLAMHVGDDPLSVQSNRELLKQYLQLPQEPHWLQQVHGCQVSSDEHVMDEADACMTTQTGRVCVVMTADCLPVLITDKHGRCVAAVHAGWRGLVNGAIGQTIQRLPVAAQDLLVWLGPAIGPQAFEVGEDVLNSFVELDNRYRDAFTTYKNKWLMDIYHAARLQLGMLGVTDISGGEYCTFENTELFYSYRREKQTGRMASLIWMEL